MPFVVDSTPPRAVIQSPRDADFLRRGDDPIPVTGLVGDDHLEGWTLRFGAGAEPAGFVTIGQGQEGGNGIALGPWDVRFVPDGLYTLSLVATDRAGWSTESRIAVTLDGRPPTVALSRPLEGGYVTAPGPIVGTASDANFASWELEAAPGGAATAYQWAPVADGRAPVEAGTLAEWSPLPPDGVYTLRLTARDKVELSASDAGDADRRHDATGPTHRPPGEGHEGTRGLRPRRGDLEREHRARPGRLPHLTRRRGAGGRTSSRSRPGTTASGSRVATPTRSWRSTRPAT